MSEFGIFAPFSAVLGLVLAMAFSDNRKQFFIVDPDSGFVVRDFRKGDKIIPQKIYENWVLVYGKEAAGRGFELLNVGQYCKISETAMPILKNLKLSSLCHEMIYLLLPLLKWNSNLVAHDNNKPITTKWLCNQLSVKPRAVYNALRKLRESGIIFTGQIGEGRGNKMFFNPYIFFKGWYINNALRELFDKTEFYKAWVKKHYAVLDNIPCEGTGDCKPSST